VIPCRGHLRQARGHRRPDEQWEADVERHSQRGKLSPGARGHGAVI